MSKKSRSPKSVQEEGKVMRSRRRAYLLAAAIEGGEGRVARDLDEQPSEVGKGYVAETSEEGRRSPLLQWIQQSSLLP
jgi:hypothetical protein